MLQLSSIMQIAAATMTALALAMFGAVTGCGHIIPLHDDDDDGAPNDNAATHADNADGGLSNPPISKLALVYRGPVVGCDRCSEAIATVLKNSKWGFDVELVGPDEAIKLTSATLQSAGLYAQPGGDGDVGQSDTILEGMLGGANVIADWVKTGGRFYGTGMGGFLAGKAAKPYPRVSDNEWAGFNLIPGTTGEWIETDGANIRNDADVVVQLLWQGKPRTAYFQDGPFFGLKPDANATVLATYASNGLAAVLVTPLGLGKVGVSGPHLEADDSWFTSEALTDPTDPVGSNNHALDLANELIDTLME